jgi:DNA-directed RNA polymerase alpha subunit
VTPLATRILIWALTAIVVVAVFLQIRQWREDAKTGADRIEQRDRTAEATVGIAEDLQVETDERGAIEQALAVEATRTYAYVEERRRASPDLDAALRERWPAELRDAARARREARDRLRSADDRRRGIDPGT